MTTREEAVQQAREWGRNFYIKANNIKPGETPILPSPLAVEFAAAYAADRLRAELGDLAKEMCPSCREGRAIERDELGWAHETDNGMLYGCSAAPIRTRMARLEGESHAD